MTHIQVGRAYWYNAVFAAYCDDISNEAEQIDYKTIRIPAWVESVEKTKASCVVIHPKAGPIQIYIPFSELHDDPL